MLTKYFPAYHLMVNERALCRYNSPQRPGLSSKYFFVHKDGRPLAGFYFEHPMHWYVEKAGMTTICTHHILRYSLAVQFPRSGGDIFTLQKIPGYSTLEMTRCHLKIANSDVEAKMKARSPAEHLEVRL